MDRVLLVGLVRVALPDHVIRICDGGFVQIGDETYRSSDPVFGVIAALEAFEEGAGDSLPAGTIVFHPPAVSGAVQLSRPGFQGSSVRMGIAEVNEATGLPIKVDWLVDWQSDRTVLRRSRSEPRALEMLCLSRAVRLLNGNDGNVLSSGFHQRQYPGERGFDNALGMGTQVAWGAPSPPRGVTAGVSGGGGGGGGRFNEGAMVNAV